MKKLVILLTAAVLSNCASLETAQVADYNRDGLVSDAEYKQYMKQKNIEDRNVYSEGVKRRNAVNTVGDVRDTVWGARSIQRAIKGF